MDRKNKACWNCRFFKAYYTKGIYNFDRTDIGRCTVKKEIIEKRGICDCWRSSYTLRNQRKKITLRVLNEILLDIAAIKQILEEENEASRTHPEHIDL